ncbi:uncharacterized protein [Asterias amurensis]|uniref:uncharacterized protein n=1 Tax=Asterias amurensis TaxID=7602 RepID=UPI003AB17987
MAPNANEKPIDGSCPEQAVYVFDKPTAAPQNQQCATNDSTEYDDDYQQLSSIPCPNCGGSGTVKEQFTMSGILLAVFCFPIGVLCCISMRERVCSSCQETF